MSVWSSWGRRLVALPGASAITGLGFGAAALVDYQEGTWTPVLTFPTPGDLAVAYTLQGGTYTKIGRQVTAHFNLTTSSFTHTTASGNLTITGLPFSNSASGSRFSAVSWGGITKAGYTDIKSRILINVATITFQGSGSGVAPSAITAADMPTGGSVVLQSSIIFEV